MNKPDIARLLALASGFDNRKPNPMAVESWSMVPELQAASFETAAAAVVAHQTGPNRHEYLTIAHIVDALTEGRRDSRAAIAADVRSAKARGLVSRDHRERDPLPPDAADALATLRALDRRAAEDQLILEAAPSFDRDSASPSRLTV